MATKQKNGYWKETFYFEGKQYYGSGKTEKEAVQKAALKKKQLERGEFGISRKMSFGRWAEEWLETYKKGNVTEKVYDDYRRKLGYFSKELGRTPIKDIKDIQLQKILNQFIGYSGDYLSSMLRLLQACFRQARISRLILFDPSEGLVMPKAVKGTHRSITEFERFHILKVAQTHPAGLWVKIMLYCGLRPGETIPLQWKDIDLDRAVIHITKAKESGSDRVKEPKSSAGIRDVPIPEHLLADFREAQREPFDLVFHKQKSDTMHTQSSLTSYWRSFKRAVDISMGAKVYRNQIIVSVVADDLVPYCLRHTYGTDLQAAGVPLNVAKVLMGHSDVAVTANIYTHINDDSIKDAVEKMDDYHNKKMA